MAGLNDRGSPCSGRRKQSKFLEVLIYGVISKFALGRHASEFGVVGS